MNEEEAREIIDNMSEQELNDFIFFALQEVEKENQKLKTELKKKDKIIDEMAGWISNRCFYKDDYSNSCEVIQDSCYKETECKECVKEYFTKKVEG